MNEIYSLAIRLSFSAPGVAVAVAAARSFSQLQRAAESAGTAVVRANEL